MQAIDDSMETLKLQIKEATCLSELVPICYEVLEINGIYKYDTHLSEARECLLDLLAMVTTCLCGKYAFPVTWKQKIRGDPAAFQDKLVDYIVALFYFITKFKLNYTFDIFNESKIPADIDPVELPIQESLVYLYKFSRQITIPNAPPVEDSVGEVIRTILEIGRLTSDECLYLVKTKLFTRLAPPISSLERSIEMKKFKQFKIEGKLLDTPARDIFEIVITYSNDGKEVFTQREVVLPALLGSNMNHVIDDMMNHFGASLKKFFYEYNKPTGGYNND